MKNKLFKLIAMFITFLFILMLYILIFNKENIYKLGQKEINNLSEKSSKSSEKEVWGTGTYDHDTQTITNGKITLKIGDYINYDCNKVTNGEPSYTSTKTGNGYADQKFSASNYNYGWRVLGVSDEGCIELISEDFLPDRDFCFSSAATTGTVDVRAYGILKQLNNISDVYAKGLGAISGRTVTVEDINKITGYDPATANYGKGYIYEYGNTVIYKFTYEKPSGSSKYVTYSSYSSSNSITGNKLSGKATVPNYTFAVPGVDCRYGNSWDSTVMSSKSCTVYSKFYEYYPETLTNNNADDFVGISKESQAYKMLFTNSSTGSKAGSDEVGTTTGMNYWLGGIYNKTFTNSVSTYLTMVNAGKITGELFYNSQLNKCTIIKKVRPVVTLSSNIILEKEGTREDGSDVWSFNLEYPYKVEHYKQNIALDGYELEETENLTGVTDTTVTATAKTYTGFTENTSYSERVASGTIAEDGSLVLKLYYDRNSYTVTLNTDGGTINSGNVTSYIYGIGATLPTDVIKTGYTFAGWYANEELTGEAITTIGTTETGNKEYFAKWTINQYTVTFKDGEDTVKTETVNYGSSVTAPELTKAGYTLSWDKAFSNVTTDLTVNAIWTANTNTTYKVEHYKQNTTLDGYELAETENLTGTTDTLVTAIAKTYTGFTENTEYSERVLSGTIVGDGSLVLKLYYDRKTYDIKLDIGGAEGEEKLSYAYGQIVTLPTDITKPGYTFGGWYDNPEFTGNTITQITIDEDTENKTYYIKWIPNEYAVTLDTNGGTINSGNVTSYTYGIGATLPTDVTKEGYTFAGWYNNEELTGEAITTIGTTETGNKEYFAKWTINQYTVTFKDGENTVKTESVNHGSSATAPELTKAGYTLSWDKDFSNVTEDLTVNAVWTANTNTAYKVEHYKQNTTLDGYELAETENLTGTTDTLVTAIAKTYTGFTENTSYSERVPSGTIAGDGSLVLKLYYDRNSYTVTLNTNEGTINSGNVINYTYGIGATLPTDVTKTGYTFAGWYANEEFTGDAITTIGTTETGNKEYFAKWTQNQYTVTFKDGEDIVKTETVNYGSSATAPELTKAGYTLSWDKNFSNVTTDLTVNAVWTANTSTAYKVEHYKQNTTLDGYELAETENLTGTTDTLVTAIAKTYTGFTENTSYSERVPSGTIAGDGSLVLKLYYDRKTYDIKLDIGGAEGEEKLSYAYGQIVTLPTDITKPGYTFGGWYDNPEFTGNTITQITIDEDTENKTYYIKWIPNEYAVTLDTNGGTINSGNVTSYIYGIGATLPTDVTKTGYTFAGWYANEELTGDAITTIDTTETGNKEYFAKWTQNQYTVTFKDGENTVKTETVNHGSSATAPELTKAGYTLSWDKNFSNVTEDLTVNAVWTANTSTAYKVEHYKQNTTLDGYELAETENLTGTTDTTATAIAKTYTGFTENTEYSERVPSGTIAGDGSLVLKLYYDRNSYTVTLNTNEGTINSENVTSYTYGIGATLPTDVTKTGYTFAGWYDNSEFTGEAITTIGTTETGNKEYFANWTQNQYTVTFKNGEDIVKTESVNYGSGAIAPVLEKAGYTLSWDKEFSNVTTDLTVNAVWTINQYTVTFKDGEDIVKTETVNYGSSATAPALTKAGYTLSWDKDFSNVTGDLTVNAIWTANTNTAYKVEHYKQNTTLDGYDLAETENLTGTTDTTAIAVAKTYTGFTENTEYSERVPSGTIAGDGSLVLKLYYDRNSYTVTLNTNEGTINSGNVTSYTYGIGATLPTDVTKEGYTFAGWYANEELTGDAITTIGTTETGNKEYFAKWTQNQYTVTFKDGEDIVKTESVNYGSSATAPVLAKAGYTLSWNKDFSNVTEDLTVNAIWTINQYTVTFKDGENTVKTESVNHGSSATAPALTKAGYTLSWDKDFSNVTEDLTVNAVWTANTSTAYKVEHYKQNTTLDGYELAETENLTGTTDTLVTAIAKTYTGFTENAEYSERVPSGTIAGDGSLVLKLYYDRNSYEVTLNTNEGTINSGNVTSYTYGIGATLPTDVTKTGYTFVGWYDNSEFTGESITTIGTTETGNKEYFAKWTQNQYTVTFKDGEDIVKTETVNYGTGATAPALTKAGYTLSWDKYFSNVTEDLTVNAVWTINQYTVTFKDGENTVKTESVNHGSGATAPVLEKSGYTLSWDKDFNNITEGITVNAVWTANTDTPYKVEHYLRTKDSEVETYQLAETENKIGTTDTEAIAIAKTYEGFKENTEYGERLSSGNIAGDGSLVLKLYYNRNSYSITYELNGGKTTITLADSYTYGKEMILSNRITKEGSVFLGWYDNENLTGEAVKTIGITETGDKTFYAKWSVEDEYYIISEKYNIEAEENYITKVSPDTDVTALISKLNTNGTAKIINLKNEEVTGEELIGTGYKLQTTFNGVVREYEIVVKGDLDGNGKITVTDLSMINQIMVDKLKVEGARKKAADIDYNGATTITDLSMINQAMVGKLTL